MFYDGAQLNADIFGFLYQPNKKNGKSVLEIAKRGKITFKIIPQPDNSLIIVYYPQKYGKLVNTSVKFLATQWMEKYFACAFRLSNGRLVLHQNFCFAETDGPFSES